MTSINDFFRQITDPLEKIDTTVRRKLSTYRTSMAAERERALETVRAQQAAEAAAAATAASDGPENASLGLLPPVPQPTQDLPAAPGTVRAGAAVLSRRLVAKFEVTDPSQVPDDYWMISEQKVAAAVRAGLRNIPGVRIWEEEAVSVRPR